MSVPPALLWVQRTNTLRTRTVGVQVSAAKAEVLTQVETTAAHAAAAAAAAGALIPLDDDDDTAAAAEDGGGGGGSSSGGAMLARGRPGASYRVARPATARAGGGEIAKLHALAESLALNGSPPQLASILCVVVAQRFSTTQVRACGRVWEVGASVGAVEGKRVGCGDVRLREQGAAKSDVRHSWYPLIQDERSRVAASLSSELLSKLRREARERTVHAAWPRPGSPRSREISTQVGVDSVLRNMFSRGFTTPKHIHGG